MVFSELPRGSYCLFGVLRSLGLVFVLDDASEEDFVKTGPLRPKQELEQRSSSDLPRGLSSQEEGHASGLGKEPSGITLPLVGPPSYPILLTSAFNPLVTF